MMIKTWKPHPLYTQIKELLERKGPLTDIEQDSDEDGN